MTPEELQAIKAKLVAAELDARRRWNDVEAVLAEVERQHDRIAELEQALMAAPENLVLKAECERLERELVEAREFGTKYAAGWRELINEKEPLLAWMRHYEDTHPDAALSSALSDLDLQWEQSRPIRPWYGMD